MVLCQGLLQVLWKHVNPCIFECTLNCNDKGTLLSLQGEEYPFNDDHIHSANKETTIGGYSDHTSGEVEQARRVSSIVGGDASKDVESIVTTTAVHKDLEMNTREPQKSIVDSPSSFTFATNSSYKSCSLSIPSCLSYTKTHIAHTSDAYHKLLVQTAQRIVQTHIRNGYMLIIAAILINSVWLFALPSINDKVTYVPHTQARM